MRDLGFLLLGIGLVCGLVGFWVDRCTQNEVEAADQRLGEVQMRTMLVRIKVGPLTDEADKQ